MGMVKLITKTFVLKMRLETYYLTLLDYPAFIATPNFF
jgi:hypothetical protein